jgi:hypothetical protein
MGFFSQLSVLEELQPPMSKSADIFNETIKDSQVLLAHFDRLYSESPDEAEVLKRAGLVMAFTAWETYVEDLIREAMQDRLDLISGSAIGEFVARRLEEDLKRFNTPNSERTRKLFWDYLQIDVTANWVLANFDPSAAKKRLDLLISKRGEVVHRSINTAGKTTPHPVKRDELAKAIAFLKELVKATDLAVFKGKRPA